MANILELEREAINFRKLLEVCNKDNTELVTKDFPVMCCKLSSMLFTYHLFTLWPDLTVFGVGGLTKNKEGEETISHYWLEVEDIAIDLTADQYNYIDDEELNREIVQNRPYRAIYIGQRNKILPYKLFRISYRDKYESGFQAVAEEFIEAMEIGHSKLMELA